MWWKISHALGVWDPPLIGRWAPHSFSSLSNSVSCEEKSLMPHETCLSQAGGAHTCRTLLLVRGRYHAPSSWDINSSCDLHYNSFSAHTQFMKYPISNTIIKLRAHLLMIGWSHALGSWDISSSCDLYYNSFSAHTWFMKYPISDTLIKLVLIWFNLISSDLSKSIIRLYSLVWFSFSLLFSRFELWNMVFCRIDCYPDFESWNFFYECIGIQTILSF